MVMTLALWPSSSLLHPSGFRKCNLAHVRIFWQSDGLPFPSHKAHAFRIPCANPDKDLAFPAREDGEPSPTAWSTAATLAQLWAIMLPLGYGGVPLLAMHVFNHVKGGLCWSAFCVESVVLLAVLFVLTTQQTNRSTWFKSEPGDIRAFGLGIAAAGGALVINKLVFSASGASDSTVAVLEVLRTAGPVPSLALFIASAVLAPATEELVYRGFVLRSLLNMGIKTPAAIAASALLFGVAHLQADGLAQLFVVGCALGWAATATGSKNLAAPFVGHFAYNAALFADLMLDVT